MLGPVIGSGALALWTTIALGATPATNPATDLCIKDGAAIDVETAANGSKHNVCVFPSGARINEWAYFRNKHRTTH